VRIPSDSDTDIGGSISEFQRLQTEFYTRLTDETLRYIRNLQGALAPAVPGTVLMPSSTVELSASGSPGKAVKLEIEIENRQRVHCFVTPMITPMADASGVTWIPAADTLPRSLLLAPDEVAKLVVRLSLPDNIPPSVYRGALLLPGFREGAIAVAITVANDQRTAGSQDSVAGATKATVAARPRRSRSGVENKQTEARGSQRASRRPL
jgi:hypothetical protein